MTVEQRQHSSARQRFAQGASVGDKEQVHQCKLQCKLPQVLYKCDRQSKGKADNEADLEGLPAMQCFFASLEKQYQQQSLDPSCFGTRPVDAGCANERTDVHTFAQISEAILANVEQPQARHIAKRLRQRASDVVAAKIEELQGCTDEHNESRL